MINKTETGSIEITYYTDPLCCWSWGFEPQWRKLRYELGNRLTFRYCMGGLLPSWQSYNDSVNSINRPAQMGPMWHHASGVTGMPIETKIWLQNWPQSSYPACIAFECAALQSPESGDGFLRMLREAVMLHCKNIDDVEVLQELASEAAKKGVLNEEAFQKNMTHKLGMEAFRNDLNEIKKYNIGRFPTLVLRYQNEQPLIISGYKPYEVVVQNVKKLIGDLALNTQINREAYISFWGSITEREIKEATSQTAIHQ